MSPLGVGLLYPGTTRTHRSRVRVAAKAICEANSRHFQHRMIISLSQFPKHTHTHSVRLKHTHTHP